MTQTSSETMFLLARGYRNRLMCPTIAMSSSSPGSFQECILKVELQVGVDVRAVESGYCIVSMASFLMLREDYRVRVYTLDRDVTLHHAQRRRPRH